MSIPISGLEVGKCYLTNVGRVWRVVQLLPDGRIIYEHRPGHIHHAKKWKPGVLTGPLVETILEREVPCDWSPDEDGA
jgi:hypothetical protein